MIDSKVFLNEENKIPIGGLTLIYFFHMFLYLINWGIYWDDWWLVSLSDSDLFEMFRQTGSVLLGFLHYLFRKSPFPLEFYRISLFLCGYVVLVSVYYILQKEIIKNKYWAFWTTAFFVVIPLNFAKITLICFPYALALAFFYFAFAVMVYAKERIVLRLLAHVLFFLSFFINSLVLFYPVFLMVLFLQKTSLANSLNFKKVSMFLKSNWDLLLLPILFVCFKYVIFPQPYGAYASYNSLVVSSRVLSETFLSFITVLRNMYFSLRFSQIVPFIAALNVVVFTVFIFREKLYRVGQNNFSLELDAFLKIILLFGASVALSILPYILVGRLEVDFGGEWRDRDTLLLPLGVALFSVGLILFSLSSQYLAFCSRVRSFLTILCPLLLFSLFFISSIRGQVLLLRDAIKQDAILSFMRTNKSIHKSFTFAFQDKCPSSNIYGRIYRSYELNGMAQSLFGDQKRFFATTEKLSDVCPSSNKIGGICKDWKRSDFENYISIEDSSHMKLTPSNIIRLTFLRYLRKLQYNKEITNYFFLKIT